jgi:DNA polymerase I-like protein with 3'-5' exonuclease and polymerase domains
MKRLFLDFESFWSDDFTLKKLTPIEYINDPRFEALGCAFVDEAGAKVWVDGPDLPGFFETIDWPNVMAISHNALFDMVILSSRYGIVPGMYGDTLSMARNWLSHELKSLSLASLCQRYGMPAKMDTVHKTKGLCLAAIMEQPSLYEEVKQYAIDDAIKCRRLFDNMRGEGFPESELETIDMVIRMATEPRFQLDGMVLAEHLAAVKANKQALLDAAQIHKDDIHVVMSDRHLATMLGQLNAPIPLKISKTTGKRAWAFAKTDKEFQALLEHDNPLVQALVAARLGVKSTLEETRTERLLSIGNVVDAMPVPLRYSGAHTHRFSGDWNINLQNLPRGGELRRAFRAPEGELVVAVDASQIEARFNATISGQDDLVEAFRRGEDIYCVFAEGLYYYPVNKEDNPVERFVGKTAILSLGYASSWPVFQNMCRVQGNVKLEDIEAARAVELYRNMFPYIVSNWSFAQKNILPILASNAGSSLQWGPIEATGGSLLLPNGNRLRYKNLGYATDAEGKSGWTFMRGERPHRIYGAKIVENVVQALAFIHIMETAKRVKHLTHGLLMPKHQVHDELIYIVPESSAEMAKKLVVREMSRPPEWMPDAPLAAEGHIGRTYYDAK